MQQKVTRGVTVTIILLLFLMLVLNGNLLGLLDSRLFLRSLNGQFSLVVKMRAQILRVNVLRKTVTTNELAADRRVRRVLLVLTLDHQLLSIKSHVQLIRMEGGDVQRDTKVVVVGLDLQKKRG